MASLGKFGTAFDGLLVLSFQAFLDLVLSTKGS